MHYGFLESQVHQLDGFRLDFFFFSSRRRHTRSVSAFLLNRSSDLQVSEIMRQMLTQAQTAGQYFTNDQIKEMTRKVSAEVDLVHQQTQNQRYGSSHIGATAKDISNVVTDAASGVVDIRNILCKIGRAVQQECRDRSRMPSSA